MQTNTNDKLTFWKQKPQEYRKSGLSRRVDKTIITTARKLSKIVWYILRSDEPFDPIQTTNPAIRRVAFEMRVAVDAA